MSSVTDPILSSYGIDMPTQEELIAHNRTLEEITEAVCPPVPRRCLDGLRQGHLSLTRGVDQVLHR